MGKKYNRRSFFKRVIGVIALLELVYVFYEFTGRKKILKKSKNLFSAGNISLFEKGNIYPFSSGHFYLSCLNDGGFLAISAKCTHLGCMVQRDEKTNGYECPCHSSKFNEYGEVIAPPATRALDVYPVLLKNGELLVDISHPVKRKKFSKEQITYA